MNVFFSHSYRDVAINGYFLSHFVRDAIPLVADQKSDTWCVAKLERYLFEASGFISVITRRPSDDDPSGYSPYIGHELEVARRARVPRLLFVDRQVLDYHGTRFPRDAVAFDAAVPEQDQERHRAAIAAFVATARTAVPPLQSLRRSKEVALVCDDVPALRHACDEVHESLRREDFTVTRITPSKTARAMDDVRLLETLWRSELCVFVLGERLSDAHLALAMAHAHCIPALRLVHTKAAADATPNLQAVVRWRSETAMLDEFRRQLASYRRGFVEPVAMAQTASAVEVAAGIGTAPRPTEHDNLWDSADGPALVRHIRTGEPAVQDELDRARGEARLVFAGAAGRQRDFEVCRAFYKGYQRHRRPYEKEARVGTRAGLQTIRSPSQIAQSNAATCLDLACLFAALFEAAGLDALIVIVQLPGLAHALPGYRAHGEPAWDEPDLGTLRGAVELGDAVFVEATGAVEADPRVLDEEGDERRDKLLDFEAARGVAVKLLRRADLRLVHFVDVRRLRG